jgi:hypothetical protein
LTLSDDRAAGAEKGMPCALAGRKIGGQYGVEVQTRSHHFAVDIERDEDQFQEISQVRPPAE